MRLWRKVHKWLGFLVVAQVLLWISGGVVMRVFPIDKVRGQHLVKAPIAQPKPKKFEISKNINLIMNQMIIF